MSIFDVFKKDAKKKNVKIEESKVKEAVNENVENTENAAGEEINIDDIITIKDNELVGAFLDMLENHKMLAENSGLLTVAALKHLNCKDKRVVSIISGGNMDVITIASLVQHGLIERERICTISVLLPDKPGELTNVSSVIAEAQGNIIKLDHNQFVSINRNSAVELDITMETFGHSHKKAIMDALIKNGYRPKLIKPKTIYQ